MDIEKDVEMLRAVIEPLVSNPQDISIERTMDEKGVLLSLRVAKSDMGRVIGKSGSTIGAVRTIFQALGARMNAHISVKVIEPRYGTSETSSK